MSEPPTAGAQGGETRDRDTIERALALFASVIECGEPWTVHCAFALTDARASLARLSAGGDRTPEGGTDALDAARWRAFFGNDNPGVRGRDPAEWRLRDHLARAMQGAWDDFCADTGCYPDCIVNEGRGRLSADFERSNFALFVAGWLRHALRDAAVPVTASPSVEPGDRLPMQPVEIAKDGMIRFRPNRIVRTLLDTGKLNLNDLARMGFPNEEWEQFAQLIGYSIGGYSELSYVGSASYAEAERRAEPLRAALSRPESDHAE